MINETMIVELQVKYAEDANSIWNYFLKNSSLVGGCVVKSISKAEKDPVPKQENIKDEIRHFVIANNRFPSQVKKEEIKLHNGLYNYCSPNSSMLDKDFDKEMRALGYGKGRENKGKAIIPKNMYTNSFRSKESIKEFIKKNNRFPDPKIKEEKSLWGKLSNLCSPKSDGYDIDFHEALKLLGYGEKTLYSKKS